MSQRHESRVCGICILEGKIIIESHGEGRRRSSLLIEWEPGSQLVVPPILFPCMLEDWLLAHQIEFSFNILYCFLQRIIVNIPSSIRLNPNKLLQMISNPMLAFPKIFVLSLWANNNFMQRILIETVLELPLISSCSSLIRIGSDEAFWVKIVSDTRLIIFLTLIPSVTHFTCPTGASWWWPIPAFWLLGT